MADLLLELFSEEIPARMQAGAARDLQRLVAERLAAADLAYTAIQGFAGPRRLTLAVGGLPTAQADRTEVRKGPRANAPDMAIEGFLRSTGLTRDQLEERDGVLFADIARPGRATRDLLAEMVEEVVRAFPWPKSMRWGAGALRWVRPLKRILCLFDGEVAPVRIDLGGEAGVIEASDLTQGHRFMGDDPAPFAVTGFDDYASRLADHYVVLDPLERRTRIAAGARAACAHEGLEWVEDEGLLDEVVGLAEWPVPILGRMDEGFLDLPAEVISTSMRVHQRYFSVRDPATGRLAPRFLVVANIEPRDGGGVIAHGNARVLSARLADARFFWTEDRREGAFERWAEKLKGVTFQTKLGSMADRAERITALAREIAPLVGADPRLAGEAARLCKLDLASGMVGEFPELQGIMGGYYVRAAGIDGFTPDEVEVIADAVRDHYKPQGPSDTVPTAPVTVAVALADKLDTLVGFFAIDERATGSKDPFALRRAAWGIIRLTLKSTRSLSLEYLFDEAAISFEADRTFERLGRNVSWLISGREANLISAFEYRRQRRRLLRQSYGIAQSKATSARIEDYKKDFLTFFADRLKVLLREEGKRHDLVDAVFALGDDDLVRITRRVEALSGFLATDDGASLLAGYKRAANILKAEAKKAPGEDHAAPVDSALLAEPQEKALGAALESVRGAVDAALAEEDFAAAMAAFATLRAPVDAMLDGVTINAPDPALRLNRLRLLAGVRDLAGRIADFSQVASA